MKKLVSLILLAGMVLSFAACGNKIDKNEDKTPTTQVETTAPTEPDPDRYKIEWQQLPDMDLVGTYKRADNDEDTGYYIFTAEKTLRYSFGTSYFEAEISYGVDKAGNKSAYTEGSLLYGQWTYKFNDGYLVVTYPEGQQYLYKPVTFNSINLVADEKFEKDDDLVGVWKSTDTEETYEFTADGYAVYTGAYEDDIYKYTAKSDCIYTTDMSEITITYYINDTEKTSESFEYFAEGDTLRLGDYEYKRVAE